MAEINFAVDNSSLQTIKDLEISANFEETKKALTEMLEPYKNVVVTEDMLPVAKNDRARIRKVESNIDDYRKMVKRIYTKPLSLFEERCRELTSVCQEASGNIDSQIKEFENAEKQTKKERIKAYFDQCDKFFPEYHNFDWIFKEKWLNKTYDMASIMDEVDKEIERVDFEVQSILNLNTKHESALLVSYKLGKPIQDVFDMYQQLLKRDEEGERLAQKMWYDLEDTEVNREPLLFKATIYVQSKDKSDIDEVVEFMESKGLKYLVERSTR